MIKNIKRAGIIFLAIAIICLMAIGCLVANLNNNIAKDSGLYSEQNVELKANTSVSSAAPDNQYTYHLTCDCAVGTPCVCGKMAQIWEEGVKFSAQNNKNVRIILDKDWLAKDDSKKVTSFGGNDGDYNPALNYTDEAFFNGRLSIPKGATISLDLNGHTIDRRLQAYDEEGNLTGDKARQQGNVIVIFAGTLKLYDASYDAEIVEEIYQQYKDDKEGLYNQLKNLECGKITGGSCSASSSGGGINVNQLGSKFEMYGGMVTKNYAIDGGGIACMINTYSYIHNGIVFDNLSQNGGGGIYSAEAGKVEIMGGLVAFNRTLATSATQGGIFVESTLSTTITNTYVAYNSFAGNGAGINIESSGVSYINNIDIIYNSAEIGHGGGLRSTANSKIRFSGANDIYGNTHLEGKLNDLLITDYKYGKLNITEPLSLKEGGSGQKIKVFRTKTIGTYNYSPFESITIGYSNKNGDIDPSTIFEAENGQTILKDGEVAFDFSVDSEYDFTYLENNERKYYYENEKLFGYNDEEIANKVLGKILPNTSVHDFIKNIELFNFTDLKLFNNSCQIYGEGADSKYQSLLNNGYELAVGTGWRIEYTKEENVTQIIYLSVLGDLTGDGKVNSADVNYLRQVITNNSYENLSVEQKLAALIVNNGKIPTRTDSQIIWEVICGRVDIVEFI